MPHAANPSRAVLQKFVAVRRSGRVPTLYWWSLPLSPSRVAGLCAGALAGARAVVHPASALGAQAGALQMRPGPGGTGIVADVGALLAGRDCGEVGACTIAIFPPTVRDLDLETFLRRFRDELEQSPFTIAMVPDGDGRARHHFCFRVPGMAIAGLERLALHREFGGDAAQVEMALLHGLALRPGRVADLRLVVRDGGAALVGIDAGGRRRRRYLESGRGYTGVREDLSFGEAVRERVREGWRRFPIGVVMFAGLPAFIAAFWIADLFGSRAARARARSGTPGS